MFFDFSNLALTGYFILWFIFLFFSLLKTKSLGLGGMLLTVYTISAFASIIFYNELSQIVGDVVQVKPLVYLFIFINVLLVPIYIHSKKISQLVFRETGSMFFLEYFLVVMTPITFEALFEALLITLKTNANDLGDIYDTDADVVGNQLSFVGRKTMALVRWFTYIWPILFWYCWLPGNKLRKYWVIPSIAMIIVFLEGYAGASRVAMVRYAMYILVIYQLVKFNYSMDFRKLVKKCIFIIVGCVVFALFIVTVARFNQMDTPYDVWTWIALYLGEGPIRFSQHIWDVTVYQNGDNTLSIFKEFLGLDTFTDIVAKRDYYSVKTGIPTNIFYTIIGEFVCDFGLYITGGLSILFALFFNNSLSRLIKRGYITIPLLFYYGIIILSLGFGFMYFCFKQNNVQHMLLYNVAFVLIYKLCKKGKK